MTIYIPTQSLQVNSFKAWLLNLLVPNLSYQYQEETSELTEEPTTEEENAVKKQTVSEGNTPVLLLNVLDELSTRAEGTIHVLNARHNITLSKTTIKEFVDKVSISDLQDIRNCGKGTATEIANLMEKYGYKMRKK